MAGRSWLTQLSPQSVGRWVSGSVIWQIHVSEGRSRCCLRCPGPRRTPRPSHCAVRPLSGPRVAASALSLPRHVRAGRLVVRGYGFSRNNAQAVAAAVPEMSLALAETVLREGLQERIPYGVLLMIEATVY